MASSNIDISGLDYLNNTDYAMSSGLEDWNDEEKMNKLLAAVVADEVPEIRVQPSSDSLPPNHPSLQRSPSQGMLTPTIPSSPSPNPEDWDNWGGLGEFSNKSDPPPGEEPDKKDGGPTPWDVLAMGLGGPQAFLAKQVLSHLFSKKDGMFKDVEFKPLSAAEELNHERKGSLLDRWVIQMKEQIGWQSMTPDERRDYIKNNKHDKNNHIIMHYNMYRRR